MTVTVNGKAVAEISPVISRRSQFFSRTDIRRLVESVQADAGLAAELDQLPERPPTIWIRCECSAGVAGYECVRRTGIGSTAGHRFDPGGDRGQRDHDR